MKGANLISWMITFASITSGEESKLDIADSIETTNSREFLSRNYSEGDESPDDIFCKSLQARCPYLRSRTARPAENSTVPVLLTVDFTPTMFAGIDDLHQQISLRGTFNVSWSFPECAKWQYLGNPSTKPPNNGLTSSYQYCMFTNQIWVPTVFLENSLSKFDPFETTSASVIVTRNGVAMLLQSTTLESSCLLNFEAYPFDTQTCQFVIFSQSRSIFSKVFISNKDLPYFGQLFEGSQWRFVSLTARITTQDKAKFSITLTVARKPESYIGSIFVPVTLLAIMQLTTFCIPLDTIERGGFSATVFVALAFYQGTLTSELPKTPRVLYITIFYQTQMAFGVAITIYSLVVMRVIKRYNLLGKRYSKCWGGVNLVELIDLLVFSIFLFLFGAINVYFFSKWT